MNIFYLSISTKESAQMACDKHVVKMILESTQMLYAAQWLNPNNLLENPYTPYKLAHKNHPSTIWTRSSIEHYNWLADLAWEYCKEYQYRYGDNKIHASEKHIKWLIENPPLIESNGFEPPPQCMPDQYKTQSTIEAYRAYYIGEKLSFAKYTNRDIPYWLEGYLKK